jgi:putative PIN family toxin of toxin-antitoxin system
LIIFDTSSLVGVIMKADSLPKRALLFAVDHDTLALSAAVAAEMEEVFRRPKFAADDVASRAGWMMKLIYDSACWFEPAHHVTDCRDPDDNKYLELALTSGAKTIVSSDGDLLVLGPWRGVNILRPASYLSEAAGLARKYDE